MSETDRAAAEAGALFEVIRARYGSRLTPEQLAEVRKGVEAMVETAGALRAVRLANGEEPLDVAVPFRGDE